MDEFFKLVIENMAFPMWVKGLDSKFILVNNEFAKEYNKTKEELIGLRIEDVFEESTWEARNAHCNEVMEKLEAVTKIIHSETGYSQCTINPVFDNENKLVAISGIVGMVTDIGKIKEKEKEVEMHKNLTKKIIDILPGIIFFKDKNSKYVYANKACTDFYKDRGIENIFGKTDLEINPDKELVKKFLEDDRKIVENKISIFNEAVFQVEDGSLAYREVVKMPLLDSEGNIAGIVGRSLDITKQKLDRERLKYLSYTDILTGAKNRTCFEEREQKLSKEEYLPLGIIMGDANGLKLVNDTFGHSEGDNLLIQITNVLKESCENIGEVFRVGGDEFVILVPNSSQKQCEEIIRDIANRCKDYKNDLFKISISLGLSIRNNVEEDLYKNLKEAEDKVYRQKLLQKQSIKSSILSSLKMGLGAKSAETEEHTERVALNAVKVGEKLELELSIIDELKIVAELHDIGKIGIREDILLKPGKLTNEEFEIMKTHTEKGYRIIKASSELRNVAESVLYHHERWDGKGYPMGLKGEEIPLVSRIISVVDAYDVMTNDRNYKKAISKTMAVKELLRCSGSQFDPVIVKALIECIN